MNWPGSPFRAADRLSRIVLRDTSYGMLTNMDGAPFHYLELDQATIRGAGGPAALAAFAREFLRESFGARAVARLRVLQVTDWCADPLARTSWVVVPPGRVPIREGLGRPVGERIWFAGEANSGPLWGTVGGAWLEGERAARAVLARLGDGLPHIPTAAETP
jgi:monoamine oxidase